MRPFHLTYLLLPSALALLFLRVQVVAQDSLETMYAKGFDLLSTYASRPETKLEGWALLQKAAAAGSLKAKKIVAMYDSGFLTAEISSDDYHLIEPDMAQALDYSRDVVQSGDVECMVHLALLYSSGIGEPRNVSESPHNLLLGAARKGNEDAMRLLSDRYLYGHGERPDVLESAHWRYLSWQHYGGARSEWLDDQANPKTQENLRRTELAEVLGLIVKAVERNDAKAQAALAQRLTTAGKNAARVLDELRKAKPDYPSNEINSREGIRRQR